MSTLGRGFELRVAPVGGQRAGRYGVTEELVIGAPVVVTDEVDPVFGWAEVEYASADAPRPDPGRGGIMVYEAGPDAFRGYDRNLTTYSDIGTAPAGKAVQVINGTQVKVVLRNISAFTFLNSTDYPARKMVAGLSATPTVAVGDYLTAGDCTDNAGYWKKTTNPDNAWLVITSIDPDRDELEARLMF